MKAGRRHQSIQIKKAEAPTTTQEVFKVLTNSTTPECSRRAASHFRRYGPYTKALEERGIRMFPSQTTLKERYYYDDQLGLIYRYNVGRGAANSIAGCYTPSGWVVGFNTRLYYLVELIWIFHNGQIPDEYGVECIDGNKQNFQISNLRLISLKAAKFIYANGSKNKGAEIIQMPTASVETEQTLPDDIKSVGVQAKNGRFAASVALNGTIIKLGLFMTGDEANAAVFGASTILRNGFNTARP